MRVLLRLRGPDASRLAGSGGPANSLSLLTFAPGEEASHLPSAVVRFLKDSRICWESGSGPGQALARAFGREAARCCPAGGITAVCRVLASRETTPYPEVPMEAVAQAAAEALGVCVRHPVRRLAPRAPMSTLPRLSGPGARTERILYASRDLMVEEQLAGQHILLMDDIRCTGASEAVWTWALTEVAGAASVTSVSLAQAEDLDPDQPVLENGLESIRSEALRTAGADGRAFELAWLESGRRVLHRDRDCRLAAGEMTLWWRGLGKGTRDCPLCWRRPAGLRERVLRLLRR